MSPARRGRPVGIGVDIGGTFTKLAAVTPGGRLAGRACVETRQALGPEKFSGRVLRALAELCRRTGRPLSAGLGIAGDIDAARGVVRFSPNLPSFAGYGFKAAFEGRLGVPVAVENDANAAAWGGYVLELRRGPPHAFCVTLGTGVGGGLIIDGKLHRGATGTAGEIGHACVEPDGEPCRCGALGCLEAYAGSYGVLRTVRRLLRGEAGRRSPLRRLHPGLRGLDTRTVAAAARRGDPAAREAWRITGRYLGIGISNVVHVFNPDVVLLVGGLSAVGPLLLGPIRAMLRSRPFRTPCRHVRVRIGRIADLGARGAALCGLEAARERGSWAG